MNKEKKGYYPRRGYHIDALGGLIEADCVESVENGHVN